MGTAFLGAPKRAVSLSLSGLLGLLALQGAGCASAGGWRSVTSAHIKIYAEASGYLEGSRLDAYEQRS